MECSIAEWVTACPALSFLLVQVLKRLNNRLRATRDIQGVTAVLRVISICTIMKRNSSPCSSTCADPLSSLPLPWKRRRVLNMPSPHALGRVCWPWLTAASGWPRSGLANRAVGADALAMLQPCAWKVGTHAFRTVMGGCVL